jgi:hypothetical protein
MQQVVIDENTSRKAKMAISGILEAYGLEEPRASQAAAEIFFAFLAELSGEQ